MTTASLITNLAAGSEREGVERVPWTFSSMDVGDR